MQRSVWKNPPKCSVKPECCLKPSAGRSATAHAARLVPASSSAWHGGRHEFAGPAAGAKEEVSTESMGQAYPADGSQLQAAADAKADFPTVEASPQQQPPSLRAPHFRHTDIPRLHGAHKPVGLVAFSAYILSSAVTLSGAAATPLWLPVLAGGALGSFYVALNRAGMRHMWRSPAAPLNVVVTGGSRGVGKAMCREFLRAGDRVVLTSRTQHGADAAAAQLRREVGARGVEVSGVACDVADPASVQALAEEASARLGTVDVWVNNAGYAGSFVSFMEQTPEAVARVVHTNLVGSLLCTRAALRLMAAQPCGGHVFNLEGAGSDGMASPFYASYGATKAGIAQLCSTMQHEAAAATAAAAAAGGAGGRLCVHNLSPGMVLTDLLLEGATKENKAIFNILCEHPEVVAAYLVPRARTVVARGQSGARIRYLTPLRALSRFATAPWRMGRYFDDSGAAVYPPEAERLSGQHAKRTERLAKRAARRSAWLSMAYSASIAAAYLILVADQVAKAHGN